MKIDVATLKKNLTQKVDFAVYQSSIKKIDWTEKGATIYYSNGQRFIFYFTILGANENPDDIETAEIDA